MFDREGGKILFEKSLGVRGDAMKTLTFKVVYEPFEEGGRSGFNVSVPDLRGCHTWGRDLEEAKSHAREAIALYLESLREDGEAIPAASAIIEDMEILVPA